MTDRNTLKIVRFLKIKDDGPWNIIFYMCGMCGHAVPVRKTERHAKELHGADGLELLDVLEKEG